MTPTPPSHSTFQNFRFRRARRIRNTNPYDASHNATPTAQTPVTPLVDEGAGEVEEELDDEDVELEDEEEGADGEDIDRDVDEEGNDEEEGGIEEVPMDIETPFDVAALGLKEIGNLASWTVSSCKPGCGVETLRDEDTNLFWQSDGPQPHHLNIHFSRLVSIVSIRIFLDFEADESYTPTRITLLAGTGYHDLIPFSVLEFTQPKGWIDVPLEHVGGGEDGKTLRAFLVQVKVVENHQNGKDTHVRGLKVYARDERVGRAGINILGDGDVKRKGMDKMRRAQLQGAGRSWLLEPDWMSEAELR